MISIGKVVWKHVSALSGHIWLWTHSFARIWVGMCTYEVHQPFHCQLLNVLWCMAVSQMVHSSHWMYAAVWLSSLAQRLVICLTIDAHDMQSIWESIKGKGQRFQKKLQLQALPSFALIMSQGTRSFDCLDVKAESWWSCKILSLSILPFLEHIKLCSVDETTGPPDGFFNIRVLAYGYIIERTLNDGSSNFAVPSRVLSAKCSSIVVKVWW